MDFKMVQHHGVSGPFHARAEKRTMVGFRQFDSGPPQPCLSSHAKEPLCASISRCRRLLIYSMARGPLFVLVVNKPSSLRLAHMLLPYMEANEGHKLLPCSFFSPSPNSALIIMQQTIQQYWRTYYLSGMACKDGLFPEIFAAKSLARILE